MIGTDVAEFRKKFDMTQQQLATMLGYKDHTTVQKWELDLIKIPPIVVKFLSGLIVLDKETATKLMHTLFGFKHE